MIIKDFPPSPQFRPFVQLYRIIHFEFGKKDAFPFVSPITNKRLCHIETTGLITIMPFLKCFLPFIINLLFLIANDNE